MSRLLDCRLLSKLWESKDSGHSSKPDSMTCIHEYIQSCLGSYFEGTVPPSKSQGHKLIWSGTTSLYTDGEIEATRWNCTATKQWREAVLSQGGSWVSWHPETLCSLHMSCLRAFILAFPLPGLVSQNTPISQVPTKGEVLWDALSYDSRYLHLPLSFITVQHCSAFSALTDLSPPNAATHTRCLSPNRMSASGVRACVCFFTL